MTTAVKKNRLKHLTEMILLSSGRAIYEMQQAVIEYIKKNMPEDKNFAHLGKVNNGRVIIGYKSYNYISTIDDYIAEGANVYCLLPEGTKAAVIVGVE